MRGNRTHDLSVTKHLLFRWATTVSKSFFRLRYSSWSSHFPDDKTLEMQKLLEFEAEKMRS